MELVELEMKMNRIIQFFENCAVFFVGVWWSIYLLVWLAYIWIRCKLTNTNYSDGGHKFGGGHPTGFYRVKDDHRYYTNGEIMKDIFPLSRYHTSAICECEYCSHKKNNK